MGASPTGGGGAVGVARTVACGVLRRVRRDGAYANLALSAELDRQGLGARDRGLATELVYGVLRWQRRLDYAIGRRSHRPVRKINADLLDILRCAAYQIFMLERIPTRAAVDQAVSQARRLRGPQVAGFVNALLRKLTPDDWQELPREAEPRFAVQYSLPDSLARRWRQRFDPGRAASLAESMLARSPLCVRANAALGSAEALRATLERAGARIRLAEHARGALYVEGLQRPFVSESYLRGLWTAQDEAAQLVVEALDPQPGDRVLDACAGVGGKTTQIAAALSGRGEVVAADQSERKLQLLAEHCRRLEVECTARQVDLTATRALRGEAFDRIVVDAPCSGLGLLRRQPEIKWRFSAEGIGRLVALQRAIVSSVARHLRPGGVLVYSVCTITEEEGPAQATWISKTFGDLEPAAPASHASLFGGEASLALWPDIHGTDGFFIACFKRSTP